MANQENLKYTEEHEWISIDGDIATVGVTDFAQSELGEIVYVEVETVSENIAKGDIFGTVEAVKTTSDLYMPLSGEILEFNAKLDENEEDNPGLINEDAFGEGWIIKIKLSDPAEIETLLSFEGYKAIIS